MTPTLRSAALWYARLPRRAAYATSLGRHIAREALFVQLDIDGHIGWGEFAGDGPAYGPETVQTAAHVLREHLLPLIAPQPMQHVPKIAAHWRAVRGHTFAKAALECALWDALGHARAVPLRMLLAGAGAPALRDRLPVGASIGLQDTPAQTVAQARRLMQVQPQRLKLKIAPGCDLAHVQAVRAALPDMPLMVDANGAYAMQDLALFQALDALNLLMIEQPFAPDDLTSSARLQRQLRTPICLDEGINSAAELASAAALGACRIVNVKPGRLGGLLPTLALHAQAGRSGIALWCGGMFETGIGRAFNAHAAALPGFVHPADSTPAERMYGGDVIAPVLQFSPGSLLHLPEGPGLGVNVNLQQLQIWTEHIETIWD